MWYEFLGCEIATVPCSSFPNLLLVPAEPLSFIQRILLLPSLSIYVSSLLLSTVVEWGFHIGLESVGYRDPRVQIQTMLTCANIHQSYGLSSAVESVELARRLWIDRCIKRWFRFAQTVRRAGESSLRSAGEGVASQSSVVLDTCEC